MSRITDEPMRECPLCEGTEILEGHIRDGRQVSCRACGCSVHAFQPNASEKARAKWNSRPQSQAGAAIGAECTAATGCSCVFPSDCPDQTVEHDNSKVDTSFRHIVLTPAETAEYERTGRLRGAMARWAAADTVTDANGKVLKTKEAVVPSPAYAEPGIKALKWELILDRWRAVTPLATYFVWEDCTWTGPGGDGVVTAESVEAAKAAAQADYERRIRSAIVPVPVEEKEPCPVCGSEVRGQGGYLSCECPATSQAKGGADESSAGALLAEVNRLRPHYQSQSAHDAGRRQMLDHFASFAAALRTSAPVGQETLEIDLEDVFWQAIKKAAIQSINDWVSDVCTFLSTPRAPAGQEQADVERVAAFLKLRDESLVTGEADDDERAESAREIIAALHSPSDPISTSEKEGEARD